MAAHQPQQLAELTRERWLQVLSDYATAEVEPPVRRHSRRYGIEFGVVRLLYEEDGVMRDRTATLLQVSADGMMLKISKPIRNSTMLRMEITLDEHMFALRGEVAHSTQTVGGYKVGVTLHFPA
jgi:hypothetical protein